jgi:hypothetical protein
MSRTDSRSSSVSASDDPICSRPLTPTARRSAIASLLACAACSSLQTWYGDTSAVPAEIAWIAVVVQGSGGATGSGFVPKYQNAYRLLAEVPPSPSAVWLLGLTDARLAELGAPRDEVILRSRPVALAKTGEPLLTRLSWIGRGTLRGDEILTSTSASEPPPLTVEWLEPCPRILTSSQAYVDFPCLNIPCSGRARQSGCDLFVELGDCAETLHATIDAGGRTTFDVSGTLGACAPIDPGEGAIAAFSCVRESHTECSAEVYEPVDQSPRIRVEPLSLSPNAYPSRDLLVGFSLDDVGYLVGPAVLSNRIAVVVYDNFLHRGDCGAGRFVFIDPDTLDVTTTASMSECLVQLRADPSRDGYMGIQWRSAEVVRYDRDGRVFDFAPLEPAYGAQTLVASGARAAAVYGAESSRRPPDSSLVWTYDLGAFQSVHPVMLGPGARAAGFLQDGTLVAVDRPGSAQSPAVELIDPSGATRMAPGAECPSTGISNVSMSPDGTIVIMASRGGGTPIGRHRSAILWRSGPVASCTDVVFFEAPAVPWASHVWPRDPNLFLVGVDTVGMQAPGLGDVGPSRLAFLDLHRSAYRVGSVEVGRGPIREIESDDQGRLWVTLPWEGKVLRVSAAE